MKKRSGLNLILVALIPMCCLVFMGCSGSQESGRADEANEEVAEAPKATAEMTEDIYVEITARQMYLTNLYAEKQEEDPGYDEAMRLTSELGEKLGALYDEYGVSEDAFNEYSEEIMEDYASYGDIMERVYEHLEQMREED